MTPDEYVEKLKSQIDLWNAETTKWEARASAAGQDTQAEMKRQMDQLQARRDEATAEMKRLQNASADALADMMRGADAALKSMQDAFEAARRQFDKK